MQAGEVSRGDNWAIAPDGLQALPQPSLPEVPLGIPASGAPCRRLLCGRAELVVMSLWDPGRCLQWAFQNWSFWGPQIHGDPSARRMETGCLPLNVWVLSHQPKDSDGSPIQGIGLTPGSAPLTSWLLLCAPSHPPPAPPPPPGCSVVEGCLL